MPPLEIVSPVKRAAINHLNEPCASRTFRAVEGTITSMQAKEDVLDKILCFAFVAKNPATDRKCESVIETKQREKRLFIAKLNAFEQLFLLADGRCRALSRFLRKRSPRSQER
jgi:hypothetical protein